MASAISSQTTARRWLYPVRPKCCVKVTSAKFTSGFRLRCSPRFAVAVSKAVAVFAEIVITCSGRDGPLGSGSGACSKTTWAFVPPSPNELTPARSGPLSDFHSWSFVFT